MSVSLARQNFHQDSEAGINKQINLELHTSYVYEQLAWYFNRDDVALDGLHTLFKARADTERAHSRTLLAYLNKRGGRAVLYDIPRPVKQEWGSPVEALEAALQLERTVNQAFIDLQAVADRTNDPAFTDLIESEFLHDRVDHIKRLADHLTNLKRYSIIMSNVRQNFHQDSEAGINKQINLELHASYVYEQLVSLHLNNISIT
ncbi:unnamed protein product [Medioppia subpectinata]|uniref:Ferritin n=1 Tax=Medioppia subpectinata TaxID=1979941 RepID=A0A7R9L085_9ACAR|nr:unnamed protein product [Medioppia subpectinata]CAG2112876.1 unnamed protein product [Medioppia subpectinata]